MSGLVWVCYFSLGELPVLPDRCPHSAWVGGRSQTLVTTFGLSFVLGKYQMSPAERFL